MIRRLLLAGGALLMLGTALLAVAGPASAKTGKSNANCSAIYNEVRRQGGSANVASFLAYRVAPHESGCTAQYVKDSDDWSYSRFGLNGKTAALRAGWKRLCGVDVRSATKNLSTDVRCALAAYRVMGTRPWRGV